MANLFVIECRGCGCNDIRACDGGCSWVLLDVDSKSGVCSACAEHIGWQPWSMLLVGRPEPDVIGDAMALTLEALYRSSVGTQEPNHDLLDA